MENIRSGGYLISKINQISGRIFTKKLKNYNIDLNGAQGRIIFTLWNDDNIPISELVKKTGLAKNTFTSMLRRLEKRGYINRTKDIKDSRKIIISLTDKTKSLAAKYKMVSEEMLRLFYKDINDKEIDIFEEILVRVLNNLVKYKED